MPTSVRLDGETEALLRRLARTSGRTKSDILREALVRFSAEREADTDPYSLIAYLVGIGQGGPSDLARRHKQAFRDTLANRARR